MKLETMPSLSTLSAPCYRPAGFAHGRRRHGRRWRRSSINSSRCGCWWRCAHACTRHPPFRDFTPPSSSLAATDLRAVFVCCSAVFRARYVRPAGAAPLEPDRGVQRICAPARTGCRRERRTARRHRRLLVRSTLDPRPCRSHSDLVGAAGTCACPALPAPLGTPAAALGRAVSPMLGSNRHGHAEACKCAAVAAQNRRIGRRGLWAVAVARGQVPPFADTRRTS